MSVTLVLLRTAGAPALRRALPLYMGMLMIAAVLFGPRGMHPATVVSGMLASWPARMILWTGWLLAATPAVRAVFEHRSLDYLRWLPVARPVPWLVTGGLLLALQAPWVLLFAAGGGTLAALWALWLGAGVHAVIAVRPRVGERLLRLLALVAIAAALASPLSPAHWLGLGVFLWVVAIPLAWLRAAERHRVERSSRIWPGAALALAQGHLISLWRRQPGVLVRGVLLMALAAGMSYLLVRANRPLADDIALYSAVVVLVFSTLAGVAISGPLGESERALGWLLGSSGVVREVRIGARLLAAGSIGALLAAVYSGVLLYAIAPTTAVAARLALGAWALTIGQAWAAVVAVNWAKSDQGSDGSRVVGIMTLTTIAQLVAIGVLGEAVILGVPLLAFAVAWSRP